MILHYAPPFNLYITFSHFLSLFIDGLWLNSLAHLFLPVCAEYFLNESFINTKALLNILTKCLLVHLADIRQRE